MATAAVSKSSRFEAAQWAVAQRLAIADELALGAMIAGRLRAAQLTAVTRNSRLLIGANLANALVLVFVMESSPHRLAAAVWGATIALYLWAWARRVRAHAAAPTGVSARTLYRAVVQAAPLGLLWGAAPALFLDADSGRQLVLTGLSVGMLCGGAFSLGSIPALAIAFNAPLALGFACGLLHTLSGSMQAVAVALLGAYLLVLLIGMCANARAFAEQTVAQLRAELAARHDPLTGLPNRVALRAALAQAVDRSDRYRERFALLHVEIENLRLVNERVGHAAGDQLLRQAADRLSDAVGERATVARLGGGAFAVIVRGIASAADAARMGSTSAAVSMRRSVSTPARSRASPRSGSRSRPIRAAIPSA